MPDPNPRATGHGGTLRLAHVDLSTGQTVHIDETSTLLASPETLRLLDPLLAMGRRNGVNLPARPCPPERRAARGRSALPADRRAAAHGLTAKRNAMHATQRDSPRSRTRRRRPVRASPRWA